MRWFDLFAMKAAMLFGRTKANAQLDEELRFPLDRQIAENRAQGMSSERHGMRLFAPSATRHCGASPAKRMSELDNHMFRVVGRLNPVFEPSQAVADLGMISRRLHDADPAQALKTE